MKSRRERLLAVLLAVLCIYAITLKDSISEAITELVAGESYTVAITEHNWQYVSSTESGHRYACYKCTRNHFKNDAHIWDDDKDTYCNICNYHRCVVADEWITTSAGHYRECKNWIVCAKNYDQGEHEFLKGTCKICGYECNHVWKYSDSNENNHTRQCEKCNWRFTAEMHSFEGDGCTKCDCGYYRHIYNNVWIDAGVSHYRECIGIWCTERVDYHVPGTDKDKGCTLCNPKNDCSHKNRSGSPDGSYAGWITTPSSHYLICNDCGKSVKPIWENGVQVTYVEGQESHYDNDGNGECDPCGFTFTAKHECSGKILMKNLAEHWYICDCGAETQFIKENGKEIGTGLHYDDNFNGKCDLCKQDFIKYCGKKHEQAPEGQKKYSIDPTYHREYCQCGKTILSKTREKHTDIDNNGACDACKRHIKCVPGGEYIQATSVHYPKCADASCGKKITKQAEAHIMSDGICTVCDYKKVCKHASVKAKIDGNDCWFECTSCKKEFMDKNKKYVGRNKGCHGVDLKNPKKKCDYCGEKINIAIPQPSVNPIIPAPTIEPITPIPSTISVPSTKPTPLTESVLSTCDHKYTRLVSDAKLEGHYGYCLLCKQTSKEILFPHTFNNGKCDCGWVEGKNHKCYNYDYREGRNTVQYDETYHWYPCEECDEPIAKQKHTFDKNTGKCTCGAKNHVHSPGDEWQNDETHHWVGCAGCNDESIQYKSKTSTTKGKASHVLSSNGRTCKTCGYVMVEKSTVVEPEEEEEVDNGCDHKYTRLVSDAKLEGHYGYCLLCKQTSKKILFPHTFNNGKCDCGWVEGKNHKCYNYDYRRGENTVQYDETYHWYPCEECDEPIAKQKHTFDKNTGKCTCGAKNHVHSPGDEWQNDETHHWIGCAGCNDESIQYKSKTSTTKGKASHVLSSNGRTCKTCGYVMVEKSTVVEPEEEEEVDNGCDHKYTRLVSDAKLEGHYGYCLLCKQTSKKILFPHTFNNGKCDCGWVEGKDHKCYNYDYHYGLNTITYNETHHWYPCEVCEEPIAKKEHEYNKTTGKCACGLSIHVHSPGDNWRNDDKYHWVGCAGCTEKSIQYKAPKSTEKGKVAHTLSEDGQTCKCGYVMVQKKTEVECKHKNLKYVLKSDVGGGERYLVNVTGGRDYWTDGFHLHDKVCNDCGKVIGYEGHKLNSIGNCTLCGHHVEHKYPEEEYTKITGDSHYMECMNPDCDYEWAFMHEYDLDNTCFCGHRHIHGSYDVYKEGQEVTGSKNKIYIVPYDGACLQCLYGERWDD